MTNVRVRNGPHGDHVRLRVDQVERKQELDHVRVIIVILNWTNKLVQVILVRVCVLIGPFGESVRSPVEVVFRNERVNVVVANIVQHIKNIKPVRKILVRLHVRVVIGHPGLHVRYLVVLVVPRHEQEHVLVAQTVQQVKQKKKVVQHQRNHVRRKLVRFVITGVNGLNVLQHVMAEHKLGRDLVVIMLVKTYHNPKTAM